MKKITLLVLLMWTSLFYAQEYLNEGFEGGTFPPTGWVDQAGSGDINNYPWATRTGFSSSPNDFAPIGAKSAFYNELFNISHGEDQNSPVAKDKWLITPAMNFTSATNPELTYYETVNYPDFPATQGVYYSTDYAGDPNTATWVPINTTFGFSGLSEQLLWKQRGAYDLSAANGNASVYIGFRYEATNGSEWFLDNIVVRETPTCIEPNAVATISNITSTSADFEWTKGNGGTETQWDVELVDLTAGQTHDVDGTVTENTSSNPFSFTSLTPGNSYAAYVRADCGGSESNWVGPFTFGTADNNDDCADATVIVQDIETVNAASATEYNGSIAGATDSGIADNCGFGADPNDDVWFSFVARTDGVNITVDTPFDGVVELFSTTDDTCATLSSDMCEDNQLGGTAEQITASGLTAGDTYYVRVYQYETAAPADANFTIKIWSSESLSVKDDNDLAEFKFYPNPVEDKLNLSAQDTIQKISVYNMLGQEVLRQAPNNNVTQVDMSALQTGAYFVKVTIKGVTETKQIIKR